MGQLIAEVAEPFRRINEDMGVTPPLRWRMFGEHFQIVQQLLEFRLKFLRSKARRHRFEFAQGVSDGANLFPLWRGAIGDVRDALQPCEQFLRCALLRSLLGGSNGGADGGDGDPRHELQIQIERSREFD